MRFAKMNMAHNAYGVISALDLSIGIIHIVNGYDIIIIH